MWDQVGQSRFDSKLFCKSPYIDKKGKAYGHLPINFYKDLFLYDVPESELADLQKLSDLRKYKYFRTELHDFSDLDLKQMT